MTETMKKLLWMPTADRVKTSAMQAFLQTVAGADNPCRNYDELHRWSVAKPEAFWQSLQEFLRIKWTTKPDAVWDRPDGTKLLGVKWFPGATLNYAENLLGAPDVRPALASMVEGRGTVDLWNRRQLWDGVALAAEGLRLAGVGKGDRVAGVLSNTPEALVAMLATASLGAVWCSSSPDFGVQAVLDRLAQVAPKVLFYTSHYVYAGKLTDCTGTLKACIQGLSGLKLVVVVNHLGDSEPQQHLKELEAGKTSSMIVSWMNFLGKDPQIPAAEGPRTLAFAPCGFSDPLFILFSSGTTGVPKCIVHGVGGTLLQHKKELALHTDIKAGDRLLYFTTCGWMMWNWMASALTLGSELVLYDGAPNFPSPRVLWEIVERERVTAFGTSPKFLSTCMTAGLRPIADHQLSALKTLLSTGSPLLCEHFEWVYTNVKQDVHLASISGGTDIVSCFMLGVPTEPVFSGEIQRPGLGMAVEAWTEQGACAKVMEKGELVCTLPFVSMPVGFWNDPDGAKYRQAYFEYFPGHARGEVWRHGDFVAFSPTGGIVVYGRSDATLNPGGVRIGTAELYRVVEGYPGALDSVAVGAPIAEGDVEVVLFLRMATSVTLDDSLRTELKKYIRSKLSPRHVPAKIFQVADIPYTRSGKKMELAVLNAYLGKPVPSRTSVANPECLLEFETLGKNL